MAKVMGKGGQTINSIRDELQCRLDVGKRSDDGLPVDITIVGNQEDAEECKRRILSIASEITGATTKTMPLARSQHKLLIGPGGVTIRNFVNDLAAEHGVSEDLIRITVPKTELDEITIKSPSKIIDKVIRKIQESFGSNIDLVDAVKVDFVIPKADVARVVGKGGETIRALSTNHKVEIKIDKKPSETPNETTVQVVGNADAVEKAKLAILSMVRSSSTIPVAQKHMLAHLHGDQAVQKSLRDHNVSLESAADGVSLHGDNASIGKVQSVVEERAKALVGPFEVPLTF
jgi:predicted RNA-binding protein YlqC (UPF0109 family)